ncbi:type III-B CRISPR module-associated Cmr3 family protein, partial [Chromatium okenii]|uniref:type III-B CRISPR module-associated Cmr3 family protein n=1 Tax=Chromatium okenii TaxID=61644 RepID=UPI0026E97EC6
GFDTSGSNTLSSLFPPPARTVAGAIRTLIGEQQGVNWNRFADANEYIELKQIIGVGDDLGALKLTGPYPVWNDERLYPAPLHLLAKDANYRFLEPGDVVDCDLGKVQLPCIQQPLAGAKPLENCWLTAADLQKVLKQKSPDNVFKAKDLYTEEPRLGIARNNQQRTGIDGLLYQTRHLRPRLELAIGVGIAGIPDSYQLQQGIVRLGGEGRASAVSINHEAKAQIELPNLTGNKLLLMLLTNADFGNQWFPPNFKSVEYDGIRKWQGIINGIQLTIECAVIGKAAREGGWDLVKQRPRPVKSLIPAGSVYFCTVVGDVKNAANHLHGCRIGTDTALGRGELVVGTW